MERFASYGEPCRVIAIRWSLPDRGGASRSAFRGVLIALGTRSCARSETVSRWTRVGAFPSLTLVDVTSKQVGETGIPGVSLRTNHRDRPQTDASITATTTNRYGTSALDRLLGYVRLVPARPVPRSMLIALTRTAQR